MKKIFALLVALMMMLSVTAVAEQSLDIYGVVELCQSIMPTDSTDFIMEVTYNEEADVVIFTTTLATMDWELISSTKSLPEFTDVIDSLLATNVALKDVVESCGLPQNVIGLMVTSDGAIVAAYYNDTDITPIVTGY